MVWLYISIIMVMRVVQSMLGKRASGDIPKSSAGFVSYTLFYESVACAFALLLFVFGLLRGSEAVSVSATALYAFVSGAALALACLSSMYALNCGTMVLSSLFGTAGLLIPTVAGIFLYDELLSVWQWIAVAVFMVGAYLLASSSKKIFGKFSLKTLLVLLVSLAANGLTMLMQKMFGMNVEGGNVSLFSALSFGFGALLLALALAVIFIKNRFSRKSTDSVETALPVEKQSKSIAREKFPRRLFLYGTALAFAVFLINQLATLSTPLLSSVVLFSLINGGATIISAIVGAVMFKEKPTVRSILGLVLGIGALIVIQL